MGDAWAANFVPFEGPFRLDAGDLEYVAEGEVYVGSGGVLLAQDRRKLVADWVAFSLETGRGVASGDVRFQSEEDKSLRGEIQKAGQRFAAGGSQAKP